MNTKYNTGIRIQFYIGISLAILLLIGALLIK